MKIYVRRRHIEEGKRGASNLCPVALAYKDATGKSLLAGWMCLYSDKELFRTPVSVKRFIARFDSGKPVKPFAFTIRA